MLTADVWTLVLQQTECTQSLLKLRLVNKFSKSMLPMDFITGISMSTTACILWNPETTRYDRIQPNQSEDDVEGAIVNGGNEFWSWVYSNPIRLTQYALISDGDDGDRKRRRGLLTKRVTSFITTNSDESFLWVKITENGLICTLSAIGSTLSTTLSVMRRMQEGQGELLETITVKDINPKQILRHSVFDDEPAEYTFSRKSLQCFEWNGRSFIMMLPLDKKDEAWIMEIGKGEEKDAQSSSAAQWVISSIRCCCCSSSTASVFYAASNSGPTPPPPSSLRIGCVRQVRNLLYVIPEQAGSVFVMDLCDDRPRLKYHSTLPELPAVTTSWGSGSSNNNSNGGGSKIRLIPVASLMDVSENGENFVVQDVRAKQVFHLTKTSARSLDDRRQFNLNGFSLVGNHAVVCFFRDSRQYSLYNLRTKAHVRTFNFEFQPLLSLMGKDCIWSIGPTMSVYRQVAAAAAVDSGDYH